jgi:hypothetical protein
MGNAIFIESKAMLARKSAIESSSYAPLKLRVSIGAHPARGLPTHEIRCKIRNAWWRNWDLQNQGGQQRVSAVCLEALKLDEDQWVIVWETGETGISKSRNVLPTEIGFIQGKSNQETVEEQMWFQTPHFRLVSDGRHVSMIWAPKGRKIKV